MDIEQIVYYDPIVEAIHLNNNGYGVWRSAQGRALVDTLGFAWKHFGVLGQWATYLNDYLLTPLAAKRAGMRLTEIDGIGKGCVEALAKMDLPTDEAFWFVVGENYPWHYKWAWKDMHQRRSHVLMDTGEPPCHILTP